MNLISENPSGKKEISKIDTILKLKKKRDKVKLIKILLIRVIKNKNLLWTICRPLQ